MPQSPSTRFLGPAVVLLAAALATAPLLLHGPSCGHDFDFHLVSWLDCLNAWQHGLFYPHWSPSSNFGAGEPRFVFYPPLTWMLGAALGSILPWALVPAALTFLVLAATGLATRALARQALDDAPATLAGCAALFSGYALFTAYERTAYGELTGGFWIPLLLLFALRNGHPSHPFHKEHGMDGARASVWKRAQDGSAAPLAVVVAGAWLSNVPLGVMACYLLAAVALAAALLARSWAPVLRAAIAAGVGIALSAFYLIPAIWEQRWIDVRQATDDPGEMVENSWLFARHADPQLELHDVELHRVSLLAVSMLVVAFIGLLVAWRRGQFSVLRKQETLGAPSMAQLHRAMGGKPQTQTSPGQPTPQKDCHPERVKRVEGPAVAFESCAPSMAQFHRAMGGNPQTQTSPGQPTPQKECHPERAQRVEGPAVVLALIPLAVLFLQLPISLPLWNLLPKLRFLQFPWRWLVALEAPMGIFFAAAVWPARPWRRKAVVAVCAIFFLTASILTARTFFQACDDEDAVPGMLNVYRSGAGFLGTDEYAPPGADNTLVPMSLPAGCLVADPATQLGQGAQPDVPPNWDASQASCVATFPASPSRQHEQLRVNAASSRPGYLVLRLRSYPAWRILVNGLPVTNLPKRADGLLAVPVPQGPVDLTADWTTTPDVRAGRWLSGLALALLTALFFLERKRARPHLS